MFYLFKQVGLDNDDFEVMTLGMCLDYVDEHIKHHNGAKTGGSSGLRHATQADFDKF